jgi:hypothetical protein
VLAKPMQSRGDTALPRRRTLPHNPRSTVEIEANEVTATPGRIP